MVKVLTAVSCSVVDGTRLELLWAIQSAGCKPHSVAPVTTVDRVHHQHQLHPAAAGPALGLPSRAPFWRRGRSAQA